jgi:Leucine-rich repeat (LRR) protein
VWILQLQALKAKSLLEDIGDGFYGVTFHDLYLEFAKLEAKRGSLDVRRWVWYHKEVAYPTDLARVPPGNCWPNLERVFVDHSDRFSELRLSGDHDRWRGTVEGIKWQHFSNTVVLHLFIGINEVLDLRGLQCLRSLQLEWNSASGYKGGGKLIGLGELRILGWLELNNIHYIPCFEEIGQLTMLEVLRLDTKCDSIGCEKRPVSQQLEVLNLDKCFQLRELVLKCGCLKAFPDLSRLISLRKVLFQHCDSARDVLGLSSQMSSLQKLFLINCKSLCRCPGLADLVSLQELFVEMCPRIEFPGLHKLTNLGRLTSVGGGHQLLGFSDSMPLQELAVGSVRELPDLHLLNRHLRRLYIAGSAIQDTLPWLGRFTALEELILISVGTVQDMPGMNKLTRLRRLTVDGAPNLLQLPEIGDLVALIALTLTSCCSVEIAELPDLHNLTNLESLKLSWTPIKSLRGLERLTQLRHLSCIATPLAELPDLSGLKNLEFIELPLCHQLTSLDNVGIMTAVQILDVATCYKLERLPDLRSYRSLEYLGLCYTEVRLRPEVITALATLPLLRMFAWDHFEVYFSKLLKEKSLAEILTQIEAKQLEFFATSQTMVWTEPDAVLGTGRYRHVSHACMHNAHGISPI